MCGIYGSTLPYSEQQVKDKLKRTAFRGPDKMGWQTYKNKHNVIFGHNRLSIIDLDHRSDQPFTYSDKIHIAFNGEIYNFQTLKHELHQKGYSFRTTSDTEVICAAYLEYGEECIHHFNGMFAFVIYDEIKQCFFGARDRLGQKPFYYYHNGKDFEFSSQLSSIQMFNDNLTISKDAIGYYLSWGNVPDPMSIFNEIKKLKAGHSLNFDLNTGDIKIKQYWDIDYHGTHKYKGSFKDAKGDLDSLLKDAVKKRLFADVPVGVFLSGGVDSSLVAALANETSTSKVKTFSVKFNEKGFDESVYAQQVADHLKTEHQVIECNYNEGIDLIENFSYYYDEPFSDSSAIPSMLLSKHTRQKVTVALSGDAGDESFIGYHRYDWITNGNKLLKIPRLVRKMAAPIVKMSPNYRHKIISEVLKVKDVNDAYLMAMTGTDSSWYDFPNYAKVDEQKYLRHTHKGLLERVSDFDLKTYLNWDINTKVDRASMAYSLEVRAPLLDYRVVEFARSLPTNFKMQGSNKKRLLKEVLYDYVPEKIFDRPKAGFTMPFANWFREDLKDFVLDELNDESLMDIPLIHQDKIKTIINEHMTNKRNRYPIIWKLLVLKQWLKTNGKGYSIV
ncbi:asparagine synthase (glutamine-hydrolyzing) [uncultured Psychroserpens sp.]|uniref:asparagine synthase (glutamine-hydrolyzing) n=1 Tax=uncultured Psychroserpens sp. TaxID=255436 RepID=UPI00261908F6|nr:asparagine synthase (glutamine-hydrolyzing) [uncultured Psychroserpens sp.]